MLAPLLCRARGTGSFLAVALLALLLGCGSDSNNNTGGNTPGTPAPGGSSPGGTGGEASTPATHAYVYNVSGNSITGFQIGSGGELTPLDGSPFTAPEQGAGLVFVNGTLYAAGGLASPAIVAYSVASDGRLTQISSTPVPQSLLYGLFAHPSGRFLYGVSGLGEVFGFAINGPGQLSPITVLPTAVGVLASMTLSPDGRFAFVSFSRPDDVKVVNAYTIDQSSGAWTLASSGATVGGVSPEAGKEPTNVHLTVDPQSRFLFAADPNTNKIWSYAITVNGTLTAAPGAPFQGQGALPYSLAATNSTLYVGDFARALIYAYTIPANGTLTPVPGSPWQNVMTPAYSMALNNNRLYVVNNDPGSISVWIIGAEGALSQIAGSPFIGPGMSLNNPSYIVFTP